MKRIVVLVCVLLTAQAFAGDTEWVSDEHMRTLERSGAKHYKQGHYKKAFEALSESARWGMKQSQYYLGFMFLKGQHVDQSTVIGMAWLGVAAEAGIPEWTKTFDTVYATSPAELQQRIDRKVAEYIEKFGTNAQQVSCTYRPELGSRRPVTQCVKQPESTTPWYELELHENAGQPQED